MEYDWWFLKCRNVFSQSFIYFLQGSTNRVDCKWEAQPLWEYPCKALAQPVKLLELELDAEIPEKSVECTGSLDLTG